MSPILSINNRLFDCQYKYWSGDISGTDKHTRFIDTSKHEKIGSGLLSIWDIKRYQKHQTNLPYHIASITQVPQCVYASTTLFHYIQQIKTNNRCSKEKLINRQREQT